MYLCKQRRAAWADDLREVFKFQTVNKVSTPWCFILLVILEPKGLSRTMINYEVSHHRKLVPDRSDIIPRTKRGIDCGVVNNGEAVV